MVICKLVDEYEKNREYIWEIFCRQVVYKRQIIDVNRKEKPLFSSTSLQKVAEKGV